MAQIIKSFSSKTSQMINLKVRSSFVEYLFKYHLEEREFETFLIQLSFINRKNVLGNMYAGKDSRLLRCYTRYRLSLQVGTQMLRHERCLW